MELIVICFLFLFNYKLLIDHINLIARHPEILDLDRLFSIPGISLSHYHCGNSISYPCSIFHFLDPYILYTSSSLSLFFISMVHIIKKFPQVNFLLLYLEMSLLYPHILLTVWLGIEFQVRHNFLQRLKASLCYRLAFTGAFDMSRVILISNSLVCDLFFVPFGSL